MSVNILKDFFSETAWPISIKLPLHSSNNVERKVYSNGPGHMTKTGTMPIYGKILKNQF